MKKPVVFFSHSTKDKELLIRLEDKILEKSANSIDLFLSSDGQSIPFGKNWVHRIEESLNETTLLFVFLTPNSINSKWLYFEAGYTYSKNVKVIPIGFMGIDLNDITPPLSLLQGFNIKDKDGLNNIISIINDHFNFSIKRTFTEKDYKLLVGDTRKSLYEIENKCIDYLLINLGAVINTKKNGKTFLVENFTEKIINYFEKNSIEFGESSGEIYTEVLTIKPFDSHYDYGENGYKLTIDPLKISSSIELVKNILKIAYNSVDRYSLEIYLKEAELITEIHRITSRLVDKKIRIANNGYLQLNDYYFKASTVGFMEIKNRVVINFPIKKLDATKIYDIVALLLKAELILVK